MDCRATPAGKCRRGLVAAGFPGSTYHDDARRRAKPEGRRRLLTGNMRLAAGVTRITFLYVAEDAAADYRNTDFSGDDDVEASIVDGFFIIITGRAR